MPPGRIGGDGEVIAVVDPCVGVSAARSCRPPDELRKPWAKLAASRRRRVQLAAGAGSAVLLPALPRTPRGALLGPLDLLAASRSAPQLCPHTSPEARAVSSEDTGH